MENAENRVVEQNREVAVRMTWLDMAAPVTVTTVVYRIRFYNPAFPLRAWKTMAVYLSIATLNLEPHPGVFQGPSECLPCSGGRIGPRLGSFLQWKRTSCP